MSGQPQQGATAMKIIEDRLLKARKRRGWTQKELARAVETSASHLSSMEHGRVGISIRTALAVARLLNVSVEYLAGMVDDPRSPSDMIAEIESKTASWRVDPRRGGREPPRRSSDASPLPPSRYGAGSR